MQRITPFLWFDHSAEEAANFYVSIFANSRIIDVQRYRDGAPMPEGSVMTVNFELEGQEFIGLNAGPYFQFTPAISFFTRCATQEEVDRLWDKLSAGGKPMQCGWLTDRFGITWQIVPTGLNDLLQSSDREKSKRAWDAMMSMVKLDIEAIRRAYDGAD